MFEWAGSQSESLCRRRSFGIYSIRDVCVCGWYAKYFTSIAFESLDLPVYSICDYEEKTLWQWLQQCLRNILKSRNQKENVHVKIAVHLNFSMQGNYFASKMFTHRAISLGWHCFKHPVERFQITHTYIYSVLRSNYFSPLTKIRFCSTFWLPHI